MKLIRRNVTTMAFLNGSIRTMLRGELPSTSIMKEGRPCYISYLAICSDGKTHDLYLGLSWGETLHTIRSEKIKAILQTIDPVDVYSYDNDGYVVRIAFRLKPKKGFCESAIDFAYLILSRLGVDKESTRRYVRDFKLSQTQQVRYQGEWVQFDQYLRRSHPLLQRDGSVKSA